MTKIQLWKCYHSFVKILYLYNKCLYMIMAIVYYILLNGHGFEPQPGHITLMKDHEMSHSITKPTKSPVRQSNTEGCLGSLRPLHSGFKSWYWHVAGWWSPIQGAFLWVFWFLPPLLRDHRPNYCGRHRGKIKRPQIQYIKVWQCTFWWITMFLTEKPWVKLFECQTEVFCWLTPT